MPKRKTNPALPTPPLPPAPAERRPLPAPWTPRARVEPVVPVAFRIPVALHERMERYCLAHDVVRVEFFRVALGRLLDDVGADP